MFGLCFYAVLDVLSSFAMISLRKRDRAGCLSVIVFLLSCGC